MFAPNQECVIQHMNYYNKLMETNNQAEMNRQMRGLEADIIQYHGHGWIITTFIYILCICNRMACQTNICEASMNIFQD